VREIACAMVEGFDAADTTRISAREVREEWSGPAAADGPTFRPLHGYDVLLHAIRGGLDPEHAPIRLETIVRSVDWRKGRVEIDAERHGEIVRIKAKRAVVTIPLGVLQLPDTAPGSVGFSPELGSKRKALEHLATGPVIKIVLTFSRAFWAETKSCRYRDAAFFFAPRAAFPTFWTSLPVRTATLVAWSAGPNAQRLQDIGENGVLREVFSSLRALFGRQDYSSLLESVAWHDWQSDPYARGAYSYVLAQGSGARQTLAAPLDDTLFFAGEACDTQGEAATVGGALRSGAVAARQVLDSAGGSKRRSDPRARL
jgi:monoamine oxidase